MYFIVLKDTDIGQYYLSKRVLSTTRNINGTMNLFESACWRKVSDLSYDYVHALRIKSPDLTKSVRFNVEKEHVELQLPSGITSAPDGGRVYLSNVVPVFTEVEFDNIDMFARIIAESKISPYELSLIFAGSIEPAEPIIPPEDDNDNDNEHDDNDGLEQEPDPEPGEPDEDNDGITPESDQSNDGTDDVEAVSEDDDSEHTTP